jgi:putative HD superfamily hydrolase of NAD metabolism
MKYSGDYLAMSRDELCQRVQAQMSAKRFKHVLGVEKAAIALAKRYGASIEQASIAALTHDYAKERSQQAFEAMIRQQFDLDLLNWGNEIWHGLVGAEFVKQELGIEEEAILQAIRVHTTGAAQMSLLDQIIYVADYIEPGRDFPLVEEARAIAKENLEAAVAFETKHTLAYLVQKEVPIYPKTLETYNKWVAKK